MGTLAPLRARMSSVKLVTRILASAAGALMALAMGSYVGAAPKPLPPGTKPGPTEPLPKPSNPLPGPGPTPGTSPNTHDPGPAGKPKAPPKPASRDKMIDVTLLGDEKGLKSGKLNGPAMLRGFTFASRDRWKEPNAIGISKKGKKVVGTFGDKSQWRAFYKQYTKGIGKLKPGFSASAKNCGQVCTIPIRRPEPGRVFVLSGFSVKGKGDYTFQRLSVRPSPGQGVVRVEFERQAPWTRAKGRSFDAEINYRYEPDFMFSGSYTIEQEFDSGPRTSSRSIHRRKKGHVAIQGFDIYFMQKWASGKKPVPHHLKRLAIVAKDEWFEIKLRDADGGDPWGYSVDYVVFQDWVAKPPYGT